MKAFIDKDLTQLVIEQQLVHQDGIDLLPSIQPASIDLQVGSKIYHVKQKFLPFDKDVAWLTNRLCTEELSTIWWCTLYKGQTYMIPCLEVNLREWLLGKVSPKSSLWRVDVLIRAVVDYTGIYDTIYPGSTAQLRLQVTPQSFNVKIHQGTALTQLMIFDMLQNTEPYDREEKYLFSVNNEALTPKYYEDNMIISAWIGEYETVGYKARYTDEIIDLQNIHHYPRYRFFEKVHIHGSGDHKKVGLEKDRFYILTTKEKIRVPPQYAIELVPSSHLMWELRVHYAWFFDPWFGGDTWATGVLEVRTHEDLVVYDSQPICLMEVYTNTWIPGALYGTKWNNYQMQSWPRLAKYFSQE